MSLYRNSPRNNGLIWVRMEMKAKKDRYMEGPLPDGRCGG